MVETSQANEGIPEGGIEIFIEGEGLSAIESISIPAGGTHRQIVLFVAEKSGFPAEEGLLFLEDSEGALDLDVPVTRGSSGKVHHVHRAHQIEVTVFYQDRKATAKFSPSTRVQRVLDWVVGPTALSIDAAVAPEMELALHGSPEALPKAAHIGRYVHHPDHRLEFDLIRGVVPNGGLD